MRLEVSDIKESKIFQNYRLIRKWAVVNNNLTDGELEMLIHFDCLEFFTLKDFKEGAYLLTWDSDRWKKFIREDWVICWRQRNRTTQKYNIYKLSFKAQSLISRMYRMVLGKEDIPTSHRNKSYRGKTYIDRQIMKSIKIANNNRTN